MLQRLAAIAAKPERRIVGLMSGTSLDGIDAALVRVRGSGTETHVVLERFLCTPYESDLRRRLLAAASGEALPSAEHARLHFQVAASFAKAALAVLEAACVRPQDVDALASHGQTLFHHATGSGVTEASAATWQAGALPVLSALTGIAAVGDFRSADVALGGTGAPLVPYADFLLRRSATENRLLLNLGGIANVTYLRAGCDSGDVLAWDVGPGNMVLDALARDLLGSDHDAGGVFAAQGRADAAWVESLVGEPFFRRAAPKSAGREQFGADYVRRLGDEGTRRGVQGADLMATAVALTAAAAASARRQPPLDVQPLDAVYVCGGGRHNAALMHQLEARFAPVAVRGIEALGFDADAKEALDFAVLGNETLCGHAANLVQVTGAQRPCILGAVSCAGWLPEAST